LEKHGSWNTAEMRDGTLRPDTRAARTLRLDPRRATPGTAGCSEVRDRHAELRLLDREAPALWFRTIRDHGGTVGSLRATGSRLIEPDRRALASGLIARRRAFVDHSCLPRVRHVALKDPTVPLPSQANHLALPLAKCG